jgi:flagellar biosynthesis/type III secretory pathway ATPase
MPAITTDNHRADAGTARRLLAAYEKARDLINIGAYVDGSDADIDAALTILPTLNAFLQQPNTEFSTIADTLEKMAAIRQGSEVGHAS